MADPDGDDWPHWMHSRIASFRDNVFNDLKILTSRRKGGNYAVGLVVTAACEALGRLRFGTADSGRKFFVARMLPSKFHPVQKSIWNSLRNGLAHHFETKILASSDLKPFDIGIAWRKGPHYRIIQSPRCLCINAAELVNDLASAFEALALEIQSDRSLAERMGSNYQRMLVVQLEGSEKAAWEILIGHSTRRLTSP